MSALRRKVLLLRERRSRTRILLLGIGLHSLCPVLRMSRASLRRASTLVAETGASETALKATAEPLSRAAKL